MQVFSLYRYHVVFQTRSDYVIEFRRGENNVLGWVMPDSNPQKAIDVNPKPTPNPTKEKKIIYMKLEPKAEMKQDKSTFFFC